MNVNRKFLCFISTYRNATISGTWYQSECVTACTIIYNASVYCQHYLASQQRTDRDVIEGIFCISSIHESKATLKRIKHITCGTRVELAFNTNKLIHLDYKRTAI